MNKYKTGTEIIQVVILVLGIKFIINGFRYPNSLFIFGGAVLIFISIIIGAIKPKEAAKRWKICPREHGYPDNESICPFCNNSEVIATIEDIKKSEELFSEFWYEKDGIQICNMQADVDGVVIYGTICLRVYHTESYKYKYSIINEEFYELPVSPKSRVILSCDAFSDTFAGFEFYKICDDLFEKHGIHL